MRLIPSCRARWPMDFRQRLHCGLWVLTLVCIAGVLEAKGQEYSVQVWQIEDGLPQNSVTSIAQTHDGYLWLATFNGLARFDGARFTVFDQGNVPALQSSRFIRLDLDQAGGLWIIAENGALTRFREGRFTDYGAENGLPAPGAAGVVRGPQGRILLVDRAGGVSSLEGGEWISDRQYPFLRGNRVSLLADEDEKLWVWFRDQRTLGRIVADELELLARPDGPQEAKVRAYAASRDGSLWLVLSNKVWRYELEGKKWEPTAWVLPDSARGLMHMLEDRHGNVWLATYGGGLLRFDPSGSVQQLTTADGLSHNAVRSLFEDREGNLWAGTDGGGLNRLKPRVAGTFGVSQGLSAPVVMSIGQVPRQTNAFWLGLNGGGINRLENGQITPLLIEPVLSTNSFIYGLLADRHGGLWIGTYDLGIFRYCEGALTCLPETERWTGQPMLAGLEDSAGGVWLGGGFGLVRWENGCLTNFNAALGGSRIVVRALAQDRAGNLYVGTFGQGLKRHCRGQWTHFPEMDALARKNVSALYVDGEETLWIGTLHGGVSRLVQGQFEHYTTREGLPGNCILSIIEDDFGNLWFGSNSGIFRVPKAQFNASGQGASLRINATSFGLGDGLSTLECGGGAQPAACKSPDGNLWFATVKGLAKVDPRKLPFNSMPPPVLIEEVLVGDEPVVVAPPSILTVPPRKPRLEFRFTGLSFVAPERVRFRYQLRGLDEAWIDAGAARVASYPYVPPGRYDFKVIACNNDGVWNDTGAGMRVTVLPPWWRTWWFRVTAALGIGGIVSWLVQLRWRRWEHERSVETAFAQRLIRSQEEERQRIAAELHDSIGQDLLVIKNRALLGLRDGAAPSHPAEQLQEISQVATESLEEVREISHNLRPYQIDRLGLGRAIEVMAANVSSAAGLRCNIKVEVLDGSLLSSSEIHVYRIVQELLNNVVRHSSASEVSVHLGAQKRTLILTVADDGRGFDYHAVLGRPAREHGLGLTGIAERVRILGGKLQCDSRLGSGTRWQIEIPAASVTS